MLFLIVTFSTIQTASAIPVGFLPFEVAINQITDKAYVSHADGTVHVINTVTNSTIAVIPVGTFEALTGIAVNPNTNMIYVANSATSEVAAINGTTNAVTATIPLVIGVTPVGIFPVDVEVNTNLNTLYVSSVLLPSVVAEFEP